MVGQSYLYIAGVSSVALIATCLPLFLMKKEKFSQQRGRLNASTHEFRYDLLQVGIIRRIVRSRSLQFALIIPNLFILLIIILSGIFGIRLHSLNFSTVFVWIVWLFVLTVIMVPFFSRIWCIMCPLPAYGEWLQRKAFIDKREGKQLSLAKKWPIKLRNFWPITSAFILMSLISNPATFNPQITGYLLLSIVVVITLSFVIFDRRTFCRYICPISCFLGLYSMFSPIEVRVRDPKVCREHLMYEKCWAFEGNEKGYGCPWFQYLPTMSKNTHCGLCMECIKTCTKENVSIYARPFGKDLVLGKKSFDEAFASHVLFGAAFFHIATTQGPLVWLKGLGRDLLTSEFLYFVVIYLGIVLLAIPSAFFIVCLLSKLLLRLKDVDLRTIFQSYSYSIVPLGLMAWIVFMFWIFFRYATYALSVISDPFGWCWNIFGTKGYPWTPLYPEALPYIQMFLVLVGLALSLCIGQRILKSVFTHEETTWKGFIPLITYLSLVTLLLIRSFIR